MIGLRNNLDASPGIFCRTKIGEQLGAGGPEQGCITFGLVTIE